MKNNERSFIPISKPIVGIEEKQAVQKVLDSGIIAQGPVTQNFEEEFAEYCGSKFAIAVNSGTAALHTALACANVGRGDSVVTSPFTFIASANSILMQNASIKFVDILEDTFNINPELLEEELDSTLKAIVTVDLFGQPADYEQINSFAKQNDLIVVEDACQSIGATYQGQKTGALTDLGCFSLYATKNMMSAEGGVMTTNNEDFMKSAKSFRQHGMVGPYEYSGLGFNYRMTDVLAAIATAQLHKIDEFNKLRSQNASQLIEGLSEVEGIVLPRIKTDRTSSFHQFTIRITPEYRHSREKFISMLNERGIGTGIYYPRPLHHYDHIKEFGFSQGDFPVAEKMANEVVALPVHPSVTSNDIERIVDTIIEVSNV